MFPGNFEIQLRAKKMLAASSGLLLEMVVLNELNVLRQLYTYRGMALQKGPP